jgi:tetratricopeptide (TPR) repeat protein
MFGDRFLFFLRIVFPFLVAVQFNYSPEILWIKDAFEAAHKLQLTSQPALAARQDEHILSLKPWRGVFWEQVGYQQLASGRWQEAADAFRKADQSASLSPEGQVVFGDVLVQLGQADSAIQVWKNLNETDSPLKEIYPRLFYLQKSRSLLPDALATLYKWHLSYPDDPQAAYLLGVFLISKNPQESLTLLMEASAKNPDYKNNSYLLGQTISVMLSTSEEKHRSVEAGRALARIGEWDLASAAFTDAVRISPEYGEAWALLGEAKQNLGLDGRYEIEKGQSFDPQSILVRAVSALYWRRQAKPELSLAYLYPLARQEPGNCVWQVDIGSALSALGNTSAAQRHYQLAVKSDPTSVLCWQALSDFSVENNIQVRSIGLYASRQALLLSPQDPKVLNGMGGVMMALQDFNEAERFFQLSLSADKNYAPAHLGLGNLYLKAGNKSAAYYHLMEAKKQSSSSSQVNLIAERMIKRYY